MDETFDLLKYITESFNDKKYPSLSLIDIFLDDPTYYDELLDKKIIDARAAYFISKYANDIQETKDGRSAFRVLKYQQLVEDFLNVYSIDHITWESVNNYRLNIKSKTYESNNKRGGRGKKSSTSSQKTKSREKDQIIPPNSDTVKYWNTFGLRCPMHNKALKLIHIRIANARNQSSITVPVFQCPLCFAKKYTYIAVHEDSRLIRVGGKVYTNLYTNGNEGPNPNISLDSQNSNNKQTNTKTTSVKLDKKPSKECITYKDRRDLPAVCLKTQCTGSLQWQDIKVYDPKHAIITQKVKRCPVCGLIYLPENIQKANSKIYREIGKVRTNPKKSNTTPTASHSSNNETSNNQTNSSDCKKKHARPCFTYKKETDRPSICANTPCKALLKMMTVKVYDSSHNRITLQVKCCPECGMKYIPESIYKLNKASFNQVGTVRPKSQNTSSGLSGHGNGGPTAPPIRVKTDVPREIRAKDFVIRKDVFQCHKHDHQIQEIDASVPIITKNGNYIRALITAGFCPECNEYFIMESTYQKLIEYGTLACRVTDEETYLQEHKGSGNDINSWPTESIIKQCGYNVNSNSSLTTVQRRNILEHIIDENVCSKARVISHLDKMINLFSRQKRKDMSSAIQKWEGDRDFIEKYKVGTHRRVTVDTITVKINKVRKA